jgi:hypothetical protein
MNVAGVSGEYDESRVRKLAADRDHGIDAVAIGHLQVHERDIGIVFPELLDGLMSTGGFSNNLHVSLISNESSDPFAEKGVIVYYQNSNRFEVSGHVLMFCVLSFY